MLALLIPYFSIKSLIRTLQARSTAQLDDLIVGQFRRRAETHPLGPGSRYTFRLALFPEIRFKFRDSSQDPSFSCSCSRIRS